MAAFVGRAEAARILGVTEHQVIELSRAGHLGQVHRGPAGGFTWDRVNVITYARNQANTVDRWFLACDPSEWWGIWLACSDEDPNPTEYATLQPDGRIVVSGPWPLSADMLGEAMTALHAKHLERTHPRLRAAREAAGQ